MEYSITYGEGRNGLWLVVCEDGEPICSLNEYQHDIDEFTDAVRYYGTDKDLLDFECFLAGM